ncbi:hypothetical protein Q1695_008393 [Nippostrongylus brasiliensis]|nr:hypothetical protein Q1695_008393 [Nippostrongylus brasiliensis]
MGPQFDPDSSFSYPTTYIVSYTISHKLVTAALQWVMKLLDWDEKGMRVDGKFLSNLRFADDITTSTTEAETMLRELDEAGRKIGLRINRKKTQFMKNSWCDEGHIELDGSPIAETKYYVYLRRSMNMDNDMKEELIRRRRAAWSAFGSLKEATDQLQDADLRAHLFDSTVLPALCYAAETWPDTSATAKSLQVTHTHSVGKVSPEVHPAISTPSRTSQLRPKADVPSARPCGLHIESQASMGRSYNEKRLRPLDKKNGAARLHAA